MLNCLICRQWVTDKFFMSQYLVLYLGIPYHKFMKKLLFILSLAVISITACKKDKNGADNPKAIFTTSSSGYYLKEDITFSNTSTNGKTYAWDFGDGKSSTDQSPTHSYITPGVFKIQLTVNGTSTASKSIKIFAGLASYQVSNMSSYNFPLVSFSTDASNKLIHLVDHGIINSGELSDTVYTSDPKIYIGGTLADKRVFIAVTPHVITPATNNILVLADTTIIFVNSIKQRQAFDQFLHSKKTADKKRLGEQIDQIKHTVQ